LIDIHRTSARGIFYGGIAGTGKTTIIKNYIAKMNKDELVTAAVNFNSYTDSRALQGVLPANVGKLVGRTFGPPVGKKLLFFIDDINMPTVDTYGTQQPIALIRQIIDYGIIFDRAALSEQILLKDIMFAACMNPKSGSFYVDLRLQRHFTTVALMLPEKETLRTIYEQILRNHFNSFDSICKDYVPKIIAATTTVFNAITMDP
jgi:dynein heavy chain